MSKSKEKSMERLQLLKKATNPEVTKIINAWRSRGASFLSRLLREEKRHLAAVKIYQEALADLESKEYDAQLIGLTYNEGHYEEQRLVTNYLIAHHTSKAMFFRQLFEECSKTRYFVEPSSRIIDKEFVLTDEQLAEDWRSQEMIIRVPAPAHVSYKMEVA
jgi:hypothetical protein